MLRYLSRVEVFVNSGSAKSGVTLELLDGRFGPSSETTTKVWERWIVVVMSIPELLTGSRRASLRASHNCLPHVSGSVDGWHFSMVLDSIDDLKEEVAVSVIVISPSTSCTWVCLNINPDHSIEIARNSWSHLVDLGCSWLSSTRKHIDISDKASCPCVVEVVHYVCIHSSVRAISSDDCKYVAVVLHALVGWSWEELAHVYSQHAKRWHHQQQT